MPHVQALIGRPRHDVTSSDVHRLLRSAWETMLRGEMTLINEIRTAPAPAFRQSTAKHHREVTRSRDAKLSGLPRQLSGLLQKDWSHASNTTDFLSMTLRATTADSMVYLTEKFLQAWQR